MVLYKKKIEKRNGTVKMKHNKIKLITKNEIKEEMGIKIKWMKRFT